MRRTIARRICVADGLLSCQCSHAHWNRAETKLVAAEVRSLRFGLAGVATHKLSRLVAKDRITGIIRAPFVSFKKSRAPERWKKNRVDAGFSAESAT